MCIRDRQAVRTIFGPTNREVGNPSWMSGAFELGQITITYNRLWILCFTLGIANKFLEPLAGAVLGKIAILVLIILFIQKRPRGLFALKGRAVEA